MTAMVASSDQPLEDEEQVRRIDATLTRLTAAHAGVELRDDPDAPAAVDTEPAGRRPTLYELIAAALSAVVLLASGIGWLAAAWLDASVREVSALDPNSTAIVDAEAQEGDTNILLVGHDTTRTRNPATATDSKAGAETIVLAHVPASGERVVVVSFPTQLEINRPPCDRWDPVSGRYLNETVPAEALTTLGSAYEVGGPRCTVRVIQQLSGMAITQFVSFDLEQTGALVDAVGGIGICLERPVNDAELGPVVPVAGTSTLHGDQARDLVRARSVDDDPAPARSLVERQQRVLAAALSKIESLGSLLNPALVTSSVNVLRKGVVADETSLDQLLAAATTLSDLDAEGVTFLQAPSQSGISTRGTVVLRDADAAALFKALRDDEPLPQSVLSADNETGPHPSDITLTVLNATGAAGLAGQVADTLRGLGFNVAQVGNASQPTSETIVRYSPDQAAAAALLAATIPAATSVPVPGAQGVLELVIGRGFDNVIRAPQVDASPAAATAAEPTTTC